MQASLISAGIGTMLQTAGHMTGKFMQAGDVSRQKDQIKDEKKYYKELHGERTRQLLGSQRAKYGASGVDVNVGTPVSARAATKKSAKKERDKVLKGYEYESDLLARERDRLYVGGALEGAGTLLKGGGRIAASPYFKNPFATTPTMTGPSGPTSFSTGRWSPR